MREYSIGKKGAAAVMHQMFLILMICGIYGVGYQMRLHGKGIGLLSALSILGLAGSFVFLAYLTAVSGIF